MVTALEGRFAGWPANNGAWEWDGGREILVGFTDGPWLQTAEGHNTQEPYTSHLSRSTSGGSGGWANETPPNFVGRCAAPAPPPGDIDFTAAGFALRAVGTGYHGNDIAEGAFLYSLDRGHAWAGPFSFGDLNSHAELAGMELCVLALWAVSLCVSFLFPLLRPVAARADWLPAGRTPRTCYVVESASSCTLLLSARPAKGDGLKVVTDKVFLARTTDRGASFSFGGWVVPLDDPYRAVMPAVAVLSPKEWVVALRRREIGDHAKDKSGWIDVVRTADAGKTWSAPAWVGDTGPHNGNPPAIAVASNGVVCCAYGERTSRRMCVRFSHDGTTVSLKRLADSLTAPTEAPSTAS